MAASSTTKPVTSIDTHCESKSQSEDRINESVFATWLSKTIDNDIEKVRSNLKHINTRESKPFTTDITRLLQEIVLFPANKTLKPIVHSYKIPPPKPSKQTITTKVTSSKSPENDDDKQDGMTDSTNTKFKTKTIRPVSFDFTVDVPSEICKAFWYILFIFS